MNVSMSREESFEGRVELCMLHVTKYWIELTRRRGLHQDFQE